MAGKQKFTIAEVEKALTDSRGLVSPAARKLLCEPETIRNYAHRYPRIQQVIDDQRERLIDSAEARMLEAVEVKGEAWAVAFVLKTLGRKRGYVEKTEQDVNLTGAVTIKRYVGVDPEKV